MKRISTSAATAIVLACSVALGAQTSSTDKPSSATSAQGSSGQTTGSTTRDRQAPTTQTGSTERPATTPAPQRRAARSSRSTQEATPPQEVTLTGCLQAGGQSGQPGANPSRTTAGTGATRRAQANAVPTFVLSNASQGSSSRGGSEPRSVGTTGNQPSSAASLSGTGSGPYMLQGLDLSRQVGQQVEVTGVIVPASTTRSGRSRATATSGATTDANASMPRIRVTSVRMLSEHCGNQ